MELKLGRKARTHNPNIPHMSAILAGKNLPPPPLECDYTKGMPDDFGVMLNDQLGDCTCAAIYHARQVWTFNAGVQEITENDKDVLQLYEEACGYDPKDLSTDQGGVEQDVLTYLVKTGLPVGNGADRDRFLAFFEVDFRNLEDLKRTIAECGVAYIGIDVPQSVMDNADDPTIPWDIKGDTTIVGGHAVVLIAYKIDENGKYIFTCISWGKRYQITLAFLSNYLREAYAIAANDWITATGKTPMNLTKEQLVHQMAYL